MSLFFSLLPLYLVGNLHCIGMCGPLVMMLGKHRYRHLYFLGRLLSFALTGMVAGALGAVLDAVLQQYHIPAVTSLVFGSFIFIIGVYSLLGWQYPGYHWLAKRLQGTSQTLSLLMLRDQPWPAFLFGFFTILLPCGQTVIVFSACALAGDAWVGLFNGAAFALLTSPALALAMQAQHLLRYARHYYNTLMGVCGMFIGILAIGRGLAEAGIIPHLVLNETYHIVLF